MIDTLGEALVLGAGAGALGWEMLVRGPSAVEVTRHRLRLPDLPPALDGVRVVFVSDLHHRRRAGFREAWVRAVVPRLEPDLLFLGGDLVEHPDGVAPLLEMLEGWSPRLGAYAVHGNNEHRHMDLDAFGAQLEDRGVRVLRNGFHLGQAGGERFVVAGCDDPHTESDDLERTLRGVPPGLFVFLLVHTPEVFPEAARRGIPLCFSGHTHGGQVALPWVGALWTHTPRVGNRYQQGVYREGGGTLVLTKGVGTSLLPIRLCCRPEVVVVELARG